MLTRLVAEVPAPELTALVRAVTPLLEQFVNPQTGCLGFSPRHTVAPELNFVNEGPTIERFANDMVSAASATGSAQRVAEHVVAWAQGEPGRFTATNVLHTVNLPKTMEYAEGVRLEKLSDPWGDVRRRHLGDSGHHHEIDGQAALRMDMTIHPVFYRPDGVMGAVEVFDYTRQIISYPPGMHGLYITDILDAVALVGSTGVRVAYTWLEFSDEILMLGGNTMAQPSPSMYNVPKLGPSPSHRSPFSERLLECAKDVVRKRQGRDDLAVAIDRWQNSMAATDPANRIVDLRTVLEVLYARGASQELKLRAALCGAWHLAPNAAERRAYFNNFRSLYDLASAFVHGRRPTNVPDDTVRWVQDACRRAILQRLSEPKDVDWNDVMLGLGDNS